MRRFIPEFIEARYRAARFRGRFEATVLFTDIRGFTHRTETAFALGERGAEIMSAELRRVFDSPVAAVIERGGIVTGFAGDAFTALFPGDDGRRARSAAADASDFFEREGRHETPEGVFDFQVRCGIDAGEVHWGITRDRAGRCAWYFRGAPIPGAAAAGSPGSAMDYLPVLDPGRPGGSPGETAPEVLSAFFQDEILAQGERSEIRPIASVFVAFVHGSPDAGPTAIEDHDAIADIVEAVRDSAISCGGTFNKLDIGEKGMNVLALFGAPRVCDRPLSSALRFVESLRARLRETRPEVSVAVGVDEGPAYAGLTGGRRRNEWTCLGDCVNVSARLMSKAPWGETLVSARVVAATRRESGPERLAFRSLGERPLKGKAVPEAVFGFEGARPGTGGWKYERRMVGRQAECARLRTFLRPAVAGRFAGMVYVRGEAGMGKTRLVAKLREGLACEGPPWHWVRLPCFENDGGLAPIGAWLAAFFGVDPFTPPDQKRARIEEGTARVARLASTPAEGRRELGRLVSFLAALAGCHWEGSHHSQITDPKLRHENELYAVKELVKALALDSPLVVEVEDAHWMEPATAEWLRVMTRNVAGIPFGVILTSRPEPDGTRACIDVEREVPIGEIDLGALANEELGAMFEERSGARPSTALLEWVAERTGGNPFFAEQMIEHLVETGALGSGESGMELAEGWAQGRLPATLDSLLLARFDRLSAGLREGMKHASALGVRFLRRVLEELLSRSDLYAGSPESVVPDGERERVILPEAMRGAAGAEAAYLFRHALMRDAAYHLHLPSARACLHRRAAEVIEGLFPGGKEFYRELAGHYGKGGVAGKELDYLGRAAGYAAEGHRNDEAMALYRRLIARLEAATGLDAMDARVRRVEALYALARVCDVAGRWIEATKGYAAGLALAKGEPPAGGPTPRTRLSDLLVDGRTGLSGMLKKCGHIKEAMEVADSALKLAEETGYARGKAFATGAMGDVYRCQGDHARAMERYRESLALAHQLGSKVLDAHALGGIGAVLVKRGDGEAAMERLTEALRLWDELGARQEMSGPLTALAEAYIATSRLPLGRDALAKARSIAEEFGQKEQLGEIARLEKGQTPA
ncbi:MAG: AAA family ATPase [Planctomycetes bacterium]|nr:AAA family ATPase [Planctomycetota bacterium]